MEIYGLVEVYVVVEARSCKESIYTAVQEWFKCKMGRFVGGHLDNVEVN